MIAVGRAVPTTGAIGEPQPAALGLLLRHLQSFPPPDPFHAFVIHAPALPLQEHRDPSIPIPSILSGQPDDSGCQGHVIIRWPAVMSLG